MDHVLARYATEEVTAEAEREMANLMYLEHMPVVWSLKVFLQEASRLDRVYEEASVERYSLKNGMH